MRLFVALDLPEVTKDAISDLSGGIPGLKWIPRANYHLTLRFIGEAPPLRAEAADEALAGIRARPFELRLGAPGLFEKNGQVHSLHMTADRDAGLEHLRSKVEAALQRAGFPPERRRFTPHVTLARCGPGAPVDKLISFLQAHALLRLPPVRVESFTLFSSLLGKNASHYTAEVDYPLAA